MLPYGQMSFWGKPKNKTNLTFHTFISDKPDKQFMAMLIGFMDGDGYFDIGEQKQYNKKTKAPNLIKLTVKTQSIKSNDLLINYLTKFPLWFIKITLIGNLLI